MSNSIPMTGPGPGNIAVAVPKAEASGRPAPDTEVDAWDEGELEPATFLTSDRTAIAVASIIAHLVIFLFLALIRLHVPREEKVVLVAPVREVSLQPIDLMEKIDYSDDPSDDFSPDAIADGAPEDLSAELLSDVIEIAKPEPMETFDQATLMASQVFQQSSGPMDRLQQRGVAGQSTKGAAGAVDRLTFELLQSMEERPTLVAWLFDKSGSLHRQRREILDRFDRVYEELGIVQENDASMKQQDDRDTRLLTSIIGFGRDVQLYTDKPTSDLAKIKDTIDSIEVDSTGIELAFTAVEEAVDEFKRFRRNKDGQPMRNVVFVLVTDERGDDYQKLESSISSCRRYGIPVHVIGVPAPFGREHTYVKYVDPDPKFDQSPQWAEVDQGPETLLPERVQVGFTGDFQDEPPIDSGFGPYALTRLCYETGGIYFSVHPNRRTAGNVGRREVSAYASFLRRFFDSETMQRYRPDYLSPPDYMAQVKASPLRQSLVSAAQLKPVQGVAKPQTVFVRRDDARLAGDLTRAQQDAAKLEPTLIRMAQTLMPGLDHRDQEASPRWQAGYDLAMGRVLAQKVRTETYNAMLAKAKRGMAFSEPKNNTWVLEPDASVTVGSRWQREAEKARELLNSVKENHSGTPWAYLAAQELAVPIGWKWTEDFTDLTPPQRRNPGNNNPNPRPPRNDRANMLNQKPKRPIPKL